MEEQLRILVVDDDDVDRIATRLALIKTGLPMQVFEVYDYQSALAELTAGAAAVSKMPYDCVFLDYRLPDRDGLALVRQLRKLGVKVPLIVLTSQGNERIAVELMKAGASDYLSKSRISSETLALVLRNAIRVYRAEIQAEMATQRLRETNELLTLNNQELEAQRQQIQQQNIKLIEASQLKNKFLATISHELRTPMSSIIGFSQFLLRPKYGDLTPSQRDMVKRILDNGKHLLNLLNEVLDFSKLESGDFYLKLQIVNLSLIVSSVVAELSSLAEAKKLKLKVSDSLHNSMIYNDPLRTRQILMNLISNAIKFTNQGIVQIELREVDTSMIAITVTDTGIGIKAEDLPNIFDVFHQVDQSTTRPYSGTGLGLAIVNSLVSMMGGTITVNSEVNKGSSFRVEFPRQASSTKEAISNFMLEENRIRNFRDVNHKSNSDPFFNSEYKYGRKSYDKYKRKLDSS
ncbi:hybrid sensor histidine kinase/response regulator [Calothrix sp. PCC 6303]|uniref:hybrid sensor histidine kinase/response regulator n=1 Tax=Calothrix sp. PCC 6303 TaxID=1170562 RepID=UPI0002A01EB3|nr:hybrid sensor histidine kinase/response regulator [Calothrix sp. PCC 6303]AFY99289.1 response regulator receiver sensor signal transduction histidine kinase [Calothrix sp. PCC 6303]